MAVRQEVTPANYLARCHVALGSVHIVYSKVPTDRSLPVPGWTCMAQMPSLNVVFSMLSPTMMSDILSGPSCSSLLLSVESLLTRRENWPSGYQLFLTPPGSSCIRLWNYKKRLALLSNATSLAHENAVLKVGTRQDSGPQGKHLVEEGNRTVWWWIMPPNFLFQHPMAPGKSVCYCTSLTNCWGKRWGREKEELVLFGNHVS